jgi:hypothetical protein
MMVAKIVERYRRKARRARDRAALTNDVKLRTVWLAMAEQFEYLATRAEDRAPSSSPPQSQSLAKSARSPARRG